MGLKLIEIMINKKASFMPLIMKSIDKYDLSFDEDFKFLYGNEEYTTDLKKLKKQFRQLWQKQKK
tara:strand:+ start:284 stop:478 length:195 start_codon:yes stop_codon:yes gene_type:complete